jgi:hypothetical protein
MTDYTGILVDETGRRFRVRKQQAGVYVEPDGTMHLVLEELLAAHGYADTPENRQMLAAAVLEKFRILDIPVDDTSRRA